MWEREDRAKSSLSLKRQKKLNKSEDVREIARHKGLTKEGNYDSANEISCRENTSHGLNTVCGSLTRLKTDVFVDNSFAC